MANERGAYINFSIYIHILIYICLQRSHYYGARIRSMMNPEDFVTIIIDGMDQDTSRIPSLKVSIHPVANLCPINIFFPCRTALRMLTLFRGGNLI